MILWSVSVCVLSFRDDILVILSSCMISYEYTNRVVGTDCTGSSKVTRPHQKKGCSRIRSNKD